MSQEPSQRDDDLRRRTSDWLLLWLAASVGHFGILSCLSGPFAWSPHGWVLFPLVLFGHLLEWILRQTTDYRGEDSIQWPIILANSLVYGLVIACVVIWCRPRTRR